MSSNSRPFAKTFISFLTVLAISQISFSESHHGQFEHPIFKQLDNVKNFMRQKRLCGSFFQKDELRKHFQECMGEISTKGETSSSSESKEGGLQVQNGALKKAKTYISNPSTLFLTAQFDDGSFRIRREATVGNSMNHWKLFENPHVFRNPCLIWCVLEKFQMINSTGHSQIEKIQGRAEEVLSSANKTNFSSVVSNITSTCVGERDAQEQSLGSTITESGNGNHDHNLDEMIKAKCRFAIQFGKCLVLRTFEACDEGVRYNLTSIPNMDTPEDAE